MPIFENPFLIEVPVTAGKMKFVFTVSENMLAKGEECISLTHNHGDYELRLFSGGKCVQKAGEREFSVSEGDIVLLRPNEYHCQPKETISPELIQYSIYFKTEDKLDLFRTARDGENTFLTLFKAIAREISVRESGFFCALQGYCTVLATEIIRLCRMDVFGSEKTGRCALWRAKLDEFFFSRYGEDVRIADLAESINLSVRQTERLVEKVFCMSYSEKLADTRLRRAEQILRKTDKPVKDTAAECGYSSGGYFSACFKQKYGCSPSEYRQRER